MIQHIGETNADFGWLLADVPEQSHCKRVLNHQLEIPELFKHKHGNRKHKSNFLQLQVSKTPSPRRKRKLEVDEPLSLVNTWPSPRLSHSIELDSNEDLEEPRYQFFKIATFLDNKIDDMSHQAIGMQKHSKILKRAYEELDDTTSQMLNDVRHLITDLQHIRFLEDLLCLLEGKTDDIALRKWPFLLGHLSPYYELNLIV